METFDNNVVNVTILIEVVLAVLITRGGLLTSLLSTQALTGSQWLIGGALPAVVLFILWELGQAHRPSRSRTREIGDTDRSDAGRGSRHVISGSVTARDRHRPILILIATLDREGDGGALRRRFG